MSDTTESRENSGSDKPREVPPPPPIMPTPDIIDPRTQGPTYGGKKGKDKGRMSLRRLQFEKAQTGNTTMLIWLGKQMLGQKDKIETSENNDPLPWSYD